MKRLSAYGLYKDTLRNKNSNANNLEETSGKKKKQTSRKSAESILVSDMDTLSKEAHVVATPLKSYPVIDLMNTKECGSRRGSIRKELKNLMSRSKKGRQSVDAFLQSPMPLKLSGKKGSKKLRKLEAANQYIQAMSRSSSESSFTVKRRRRSKSLEKISSNISINGSSDHQNKAETGKDLIFTRKNLNGKKFGLKKRDSSAFDDDIMFSNENTESVLFNNDDNLLVNNDTDSNDSCEIEDWKNEVKPRKRKLSSKKSAMVLKRTKNKNVNDPQLIVDSPLAEGTEASDGLDGKARKLGKSKSSQPPNMSDSLRASVALLDQIINPVSAVKFFEDVWEKKPLFIRRHNPKHNEGWFSTAEFDRILRQHRINYTENLDVVSYSGGQRETHNPAGRALPAVVWDYYNNGCSVRLLNPQTYSEEVWRRLALLQEYFGCVAGANVYLTPPGTQGFAPHYDDIEAFVLQLEGRKHWRVYEPRNDAEVLPRFSSGNFTDADLSDPVLDIVLEPGDLLYFPRGFIHQGNAVEDAHSLHITVSVGQRNTYADLLEKLIPRALEAAVEEDVDFRLSLPRDCFTYMGVAYSDNESLGSKRAEFLQIIDRLMDKLKSYAPVDAAVDQAAKKFLEDSLPPCLTQEEKLCSVMSSESGACWDSQTSSVTNCTAVTADTEIRVVRQHSVRLVSEDSGVSIYHNVENSRLYHETVSKNMEVDAEMAEAVEFILNSYPRYVRVDSLPLDSLEKQVSLAADLYERGLLLTRRPLEEVQDD